MALQEKLRICTNKLQHLEVRLTGNAFTYIQSMIKYIFERFMYKFHFIDTKKSFIVAASVQISSCFHNRQHTDFHYRKEADAHEQPESPLCVG